MKFLLAVILCIPGFLYGCSRFVLDVSFDRNCGGHLKRAADANSVELAREELLIALQYMQEEDLTEGYTSVLYRTPDEDVGFWYKNVRTSYEELRDLPDTVTPLERSNMLMKLRETLLDEGASITVPSGIAVFPNNLAFALMAILCSILALIGFLYFMAWMED